MTFLVFDESTFIRADITETLRSAFSEAAITCLDAISDIGRMGLDAGDSVIAVISVSGPDTLRELSDLRLSAQDLRFIVIGDNSEDFGAGESDSAFRFLERPFSSATLLDAVRTLFSGPHSSR